MASISSREGASHSHQEEGTPTVGAAAPEPMELEDGRRTLSEEDQQAAGRQQQPPGQSLLLQLEAQINGQEVAHLLFALLPQHHLVATAIIGATAGYYMIVKEEKQDEERKARLATTVAPAVRTAEAMLRALGELVARQSADESQKVKFSSRKRSASMAIYADFSSVVTRLPLCSCARSKHKPQSSKTTFKIAATMQLAKTQMKDGALTAVLERILYQERISAVAEAGLLTPLTELPQANQRGMIAEQLHSVLPMAVEASSGLCHQKQSDLAARLAKLAMRSAN